MHMRNGRLLLGLPMIWLLVVIGILICLPFFKWLLTTFLALAFLVPLVLVDIYEAIAEMVDPRR